MDTATHQFSQLEVGPVGGDEVESHAVLLGYLFWVIGFTGAHRFFFGKPLTGALWFFTGGLFGIGYVYDLLTMNEQIAEIQ